jgi:hypothetical protein
MALETITCPDCWLYWASTCQRCWGAGEVEVQRGPNTDDEVPYRSRCWNTWARSFRVGVGQGKVKAKCSFHDDTLPLQSSTMPTTGSDAYACGETGDAIELLMRHEGDTLCGCRRASRGTYWTSAVRRTKAQQPGSGGLFDDTGIF